MPHNNALQPTLMSPPKRGSMSSVAALGVAERGFRGRVSVVTLTLSLLILVPLSASAQLECDEAAAFQSFFDRFSDDLALQAARLSNAVSISHWESRGGSDVLTWKSYTPAELMKSQRSLLPSTDDQRKLYVRTVTMPSADRTVVTLVKDESDSYDMTFRFHLVEGCWYLAEIQDDYIDP